MDPTALHDVFRTAALLAIALFLALIFWMLTAPQHWRWLLKRKRERAQESANKNKGKE